MRIRDLVVRDRPRERLHEYGLGALSDAELLALVLRTGSVDENVLNQAARLLSAFSLAGLAKAPATELQTFPGIGVAKAAQIVAAFELSRRLAVEQRPTRITNRSEALSYCSPLLSHFEQEHVLAVWLDVRNQVIGHEIVGKGLLDSSLVHAREVFRGAIRANAASILVAHNHPSGVAEESEEDIQVTTSLRDWGKMLGIPVLDHLVVARC